MTTPAAPNPQPFLFGSNEQTARDSSISNDVIRSFFPSRPSLGPTKRQRVALIGTYAPRKCGIATFSSDIVEQLGKFHPEIEFDVHVLDDGAAALDYPESARVIRQHDREDYRCAARRINEANVDAVWLQHEFGIFGGVEGVYVRDLVERLAAPLIVTLHTVLTDPSPSQREIVEFLITRASRLMVMSEQGRSLLIERYGAPADVVTVIPHGAPDRPFGRSAAFKEALGLAGRNVLMTFGLLGPGKGLELAIEALPAIVARHPNTVYRIVGATHPNLVARDGEAYREGLQELATRLGVAEHIVWENRFLDTGELLDQLEACDIYLTPYHNLQQSTSGTLSYAVALGKAVVSTPYVHARELLNDGVGTLIDPHSSEAIARAVNELLDDPVALAAMQRRAYARGRTTIWHRFADRGAELVEAAVAPEPRVPPLTATPGLTGLLTMSDSTGMLQHAIGTIPDRRHGYCLDDNARALMLVNLSEGMTPAERAQLSSAYASFVQYAWNPDLGRFRNFMHFDRTWCEDCGSEDSNGRALWALGQTVETSQDPDLRSWAYRWFCETSGLAAELGSPRAVAFAMLGAAAVARAIPGDELATSLLERGGDLLDRLLVSTRRPDWAWFEAVLGYDNPRLPQALIEAGSLLHRNDWIAAGLDTLEWIAARQIAASGHFRPIGSETFGLDHAALPFDQQPLEAQAAVEAAAAAWRATRDPAWLDHAMVAWEWYFGRNDRGVCLADVSTGRCRDGVTPRGRNENCGAESILAFQLAHYSMLALARAAEVDARGDSFEQGSLRRRQPVTSP
jgi:glycosyltransferase involved in cell wall biosynthesis